MNGCGLGYVNSFDLEKLYGKESGKIAR